MMSLRGTLIAGAAAFAVAGALAASPAQTNTDQGSPFPVSVTEARPANGSSGAYGTRGPTVTGDPTLDNLLLPLSLLDPRSDSQPALSSTARYVVFMSRATNLVRKDLNGAADIFIRDRDADSDGKFDTQGFVLNLRASVANDGRESSGDSIWPAISGSGRFVAFVSSANNLVSGDTNQLPDVFVRDRDADGNGVYDEAGPGKTATTRASLRSDGTQMSGVATAVAGGTAGAPAISDDGRYVAFASWAPFTPDALVNCGPPDHPEACSNVFLVDRDADGSGSFYEAGNQQSIRLVSATPDGMPGNAASGSIPPLFPGRAPAMTPDGRFLAFHSYATNLVPGDFDVNEAPDVFIRDRDSDGDGIFDEAEAATMTRVVAPQRLAGRYRSFFPSISADGRHVAYQAVGSIRTVSNLDLDLESRVFVYDRVAGTTGDIGLSRLLVQGELRHHAPTISSTGRFVVFTAAMALSNQIRDLGDVRTDVLMHDRDLDENGVFDEPLPDQTSTILISHSGLGVVPSVGANSYGGVLSRDQTFLGFISVTSGFGTVLLWKRTPGVCAEICV